MKRLISAALTVFIAFCLLLATDRRAWGYVDPGSGLIALQTAASIAAASLYAVRRRIRSLFSSEKKVATVVHPSKHVVDESREAA
jgi:hypothetical protein